MVQPQPDGPMQWDMSGEESGGALRVPAELAANEVVTRLLGDNQQLREALRHSNLALRQRCEEMEGWQRRTREEREFLSCRFQEARALVERLAQENHSLQGLVNGPSGMPSSSSSSDPTAFSSASQTEALRVIPARNGPLDAPQTLDQRERKRGEEINQHTQTMPPRSLPVEGANEFLQLLKSHKEKMEEEMRGLKKRNEELEKEREEGLKEKELMRCSIEKLTAKLSQAQPVEGANEFLQLLKNNKEKMEEGMRELKRKNEELEKDREEGLKEKEFMRCSIEKLTAKLSQAQACSATEEVVVHRSEAQHSSDRYRELEDKLDYLQKSSAQRDRTEALLKQKEKECNQLGKDCEALKAQATSLLGELKERQSCLEKSEHERKIMEDKLNSKNEALVAAEREMEQQRKQHHVAMDKLLLQTQNLETALKTERNIVTEERKKLTQLQHAYTCLFRDYDSKLKNEGDNMSSRLEDAERALALKQDLIDKLKEEVEQQRGSLETVPVLTAQAEIYKADFLAEREAREKLHQRKEELQDQLNHTLAENERLKMEVASRACMEEMQQRHLEHNDYRAQRTPNIPPPQGPFPGGPFNTAPPPSSFRSQGLPPGGPGGVVGVEERPDFRCPKCQYQAPDMDTLQIHVMDCIQ